MLAGIAAGLANILDKWNEFKDSINKDLDKIKENESDPFEAASPKSVLENSIIETPEVNTTGETPEVDAAGDIPEIDTTGDIPNES